MKLVVYMSILLIMGRMYLCEGDLQELNGQHGLSYIPGQQALITVYQQEEEKCFELYQAEVKYVSLAGALKKRQEYLEAKNQRRCNHINAMANLFN